MFRHILVPLDGSARAEYALPMAARLARNTSGTLLLVRAVCLTSEYWPVIATPYPSMAQAAVDSELKEAEDYLQDLASSSQLAGLTVKTEVLFGPPASTILSVATAYNVDLIMMCSHGYSGVARWIMGSVAEKIARHSAVPVLILREGNWLPSCISENHRALRALVPLDGSPHAKAALEPAAELLAALAGDQQQAELHLARIVKPSAQKHKDTKPLFQSASDLNKARHYLDLTVEQLDEGYIAPAIKKFHIPVTSSVALGDDVADSLVHIAEYGSEADDSEAIDSCDLIAISTHGGGGLMRWTMGSIAERVLHATKLPILIVRPIEMVRDRSSFSLMRRDPTYVM
jgi:nucleotide-binding universal stress UspA family protein